MTGSSQRRRSSTTTSRNENHRPTTDTARAEQRGEEGMEGQRAAKGLSGGGPCFKRNARLTFLRDFHARGARLLGRRAVRRDTRLDSVRLRHRRLSSSVSRSQGRSQEASLAPRPTSCSPTPTRLLVALALDHRSVKAYHTRVSTASRKLCFFWFAFFWLSLLRVFLLCYSSSFGTLYRSRARVEYLAREEILEMSKQKFPSREHSW